MDTSPPPWPLGRNPDGTLDVLGIPDWLKYHPELIRRGIELCETLKPSYVFATNWRDDSGPAHAVKILEPHSEEATIYERLARDPGPSNPSIPCELIRSEQPFLLVMPYLFGIEYVPYSRRSLSYVLGVFLQAVESIEYLHARHIAHLDMCVGNILIASDDEVKFDPRLVADKVYIIDFHTSQQIQFGPGVQRAISLPFSQERPPLGLKHFDPYSWNVYCLGKLWK
ncbi:hypothetical protein C8Q79DRAFT_444708 [Trametes meyenii]|nr:hypothetical protein C8Q79DRAFT_444708 [Trametes meyenii]